MAIFVLTMVKGPAWNAARGRREQDAWDDHAAFMDALVADRPGRLGVWLAMARRCPCGCWCARTSAAGRRRALHEYPRRVPVRRTPCRRIGQILPWTL